MNNTARITHCTLGELMIYQIARSIEDRILAFHGFGSPLVQLALHLAKSSHAPNLILVGGATYGINPKPPFLTPTTNDFAMNRGAECHLSIEELFDLAASGRLGRMFLSGLQIDRWGNMNVTRLGNGDRLTLKLPGGGGGCNLSADADRITIWTAAHRTQPDDKGRRRYRLVERCDFITSIGHHTADGMTRSSMSYLGKGPDCIVTDLGVFGFNSDGHAELQEVYSDTNVELVAENTGFEFPVAINLTTATLPNAEMIEYIRRLDPLKIHERELSQEDRLRRFELNEVN